MKKGLIVAATFNEIAPFYNRVENSELKNRLAVLITGVGAVNTCYNLMQHLQYEKFDVVINAGIAGSYNLSTRIGETIIIGKDTFGDIGSEKNGEFMTFFDKNWQDRSREPFSGGFISPYEFHYPFFKAYRQVTGITVNRVTDNEEIINERKRLFNPDVESMEGASVFYVCRNLKIPSLQLRTISNYLIPGYTHEWEISGAIEKLNGILNKFADTLL